MDIRVEPRDDLTVDELRELSNKAGVEFSQAIEQFRVTAALAVGPSVSQTTTPTKVGFQFLSASKDKLIQAQTDGWSFSKLAPYDSWDSFSAQGRQLWTMYREIAQPKKIARVALRYVNRLDLPIPFDDFKRYLRTAPEIAPDLPQGLSNFFMQVQIPQVDMEALLVINMTMAHPPAEGLASVILDLDLFRQSNLPNDEEALWQYFEQLRARKNTAFEACITDAMRERFY